MIISAVQQSDPVIHSLFSLGYFSHMDYHRCWIEFSVLYSRFPLANSSIHVCVHMLIPTPRPSLPHPHLSPLVTISFFLSFIDFFLSFFLFFFFFLGLHLQHKEVPRLGVKSELQLLVYTTATAAPDLSLICHLHHSS